MACHIVPIGNLLFLLKEEPRTRTELYNSGVFYGWRDLYKTIQVCRKAGLIVKDHREWFDWDINLRRRRFHDWFAITSLGLNFLKFYDNDRKCWNIEKYRKSDVNRRGQKVTTVAK